MDQPSIMTDSQVITIILSILVPMLTGFGWVLSRIFKMNESITGLDCRLSRMEGYLEGRDVGAKEKKGA